MKKRLFRRGKLYVVTFLDHCLHDTKAAMVNVCGWANEENKDIIVFSTWELQSKNKRHVKMNREIFSLVKSCIVNIRLIE